MQPCWNLGENPRMDLDLPSLAIPGIGATYLRSGRPERECQAMA